MRKSEPIYHVFLSYAAEDVDLANRAAHLLAEQGLTSFRPSGVEAGQKLWTRVSEALAESAAVVCLFRSEPGPSSNVALELGAAVAWSKPVFLVCQRHQSQKVGSLWGFDVYSWEDWPAIVRRIKAADKPLSEEDRSLLTQMYIEHGVPTDQFMHQPAALESLTRDFNARAPRMVSGERLLNALLRLRKQGSLPSLARHRRMPVSAK